MPHGARSHEGMACFQRAPDTLHRPAFLIWEYRLVQGWVPNLQLESVPEVNVYPTCPGRIEAGPTLKTVKNIQGCIASDGDKTTEVVIRGSSEGQLREYKK